MNLTVTGVGSGMPSGLTAVATTLCLPTLYFFVNGDVHGFAEPLEAVLYAMGESASKAGAGHLTFLGDLMDKGPDPAGALRLAVTAAEQWGFTEKTLLTGNHDLFLLLILDDVGMDIPPRPAFLEIAELNGFLDTLDQLGVEDLPDLRPRLIELLGEDGLALLAERLERWSSERTRK